jgi:hypothetical protein
VLAQVARAGEQAVGQPAQALGHQVRVARQVGADIAVHALGQVLQAVAGQVQVAAHLRVAFGKGLQHLADEGGAEVVAGQHPQVARQAFGQVLHRHPGLVQPGAQVGQHLAAVQQVGLRGLGGHHAPRRAHEQRHAQLGLQPGDLPAQRGLGHAALGLGPGQAAMGHQQHEVLDQPDVDHGRQCSTDGTGHCARPLTSAAPARYKAGFAVCPKDPDDCPAA